MKSHALHPPTCGSAPGSPQTTAVRGGGDAETSVRDAGPPRGLPPRLSSARATRTPAPTSIWASPRAPPAPGADLCPAARCYVTGCAQSKMAAFVCSRGLGPGVSGRCGRARRVGGCPGFCVTFSRPHTGAFLEPRAAVCPARPARLRRVRQGERSVPGRRTEDVGQGVGTRGGGEEDPGRTWVGRTDLRPLFARRIGRPGSEWAKGTNR